jgi:hypothetical protein
MLTQIGELLVTRQDRERGWSKNSNGRVAQAAPRDGTETIASLRARTGSPD